MLNDGGKPVVILCAKPQNLDAIRRPDQVEIVAVPQGEDDHLDLKAALAALAARGITRVMVEAGPTLAEAFANAGMIDAVVLLTGPEKAGEGLGAIGPALADWQAKAHLVERRRIGHDLCEIYEAGR
jgi:diaminohydroxyphosphoribosylaminopyrimidine deaminase/5-amino-6-(5-phosphoribosylamino)uracil reductase